MSQLQSAEAIESFLDALGAKTLKALLTGSKYQIVAKYLSYDLNTMHCLLSTDFRDVAFAEISQLYSLSEYSKARALLSTICNLIKKRQYEIRRYEVLSDSEEPLTREGDPIDINDILYSGSDDLEEIHKSFFSDEHIDISEALKAIESDHKLKEGEMRRCLRSYEDFYKDTVVEYQTDFLDEILQYTLMFFPDLIDEVDEFYRNNQYTNYERNWYSRETQSNTHSTIVGSAAKPQRKYHSFKDLFVDGSSFDSCIQCLYDLTPPVISVEHKFISQKKSYLIAFIDALKKTDKIATDIQQKELINHTNEYFHLSLSRKTFSYCKETYTYETALKELYEALKSI